MAELIAGQAVAAVWSLGTAVTGSAVKAWRSAHQSVEHGKGSGG